jgi:hypothetical protein
VGFATVPVAVVTALGVAVVAAARPPGAPSARSAALAAHATSGLPANLSLRVQAAAPSATVTRARATLVGELGRDGFVTPSAESGGLAMVGRTNGFLTGASGAAPRDVALGYVRAHLAAFGLAESDLAGLGLAR